MKRNREWEPENSGPSKKIANNETRAKLDEPSRHPSPPGRTVTPRDHYRRSSSEIRRENAQRVSENYHPSEAAHHPYSLPPQQIPSMHTILDGSKEDRKENIEPAARKMEVDEDYDNNSDDDKRGGSATASGTATKNSPVQPPTAAPKQEIAA
jgi:general transcriptional corepressor CYC8